MTERLKRQLPNALSGANLGCGFLAVLLLADRGGAMMGPAMLLVGLGSLLDYADGSLARRWGVASDLGRQIDSLADLVTFGAAPLLIAWFSGLDRLGIPGIVLLLLFGLSGAFRLARFAQNRIWSPRYRGLPIPLAGLAVVGFSWWGAGPVLLAVVTAVLAILMNAPLEISRPFGE